MQTTQKVRVSDLEAKAWRVHFKDSLSGAGTQISVIKSPRRLFAQWVPVDAASPPSRAEHEDGKSLAVLWMPPDAPAAAEAAWISAVPPEASSGMRVVRAGIRTARVIWSDSLAIVYAPPEQLDDALDALARFTIVERDSTALEDGMPEVWSSLEEDTRLSHTVRPWDHWRRKTRVNRMTDVLTRMASCALRLKVALEQIDPAIPSASKRLFAELASQSGLYDRLEIVREPIDFALEQYEIINTRMIEDKHSAESVAVDFAILIALIGDLIFVAYPYIMGLPT